MRTLVRRPCRAGQFKGAASAFNADLNNRQLHPDERRRAADLAKKSGGRYTQEDIENALRNAGNRELGEDITTGMTARSNDEVYDTGAVWRAGELASLAAGRLCKIEPIKAGQKP